MTTEKDNKVAENRRKEEEKKIDAQIDKAEKEFFDQEKKQKEDVKQTDKQTKKASKPQTKPALETPKFEVTDFNPWTVLKFPHLTEKSMNMVELENKLVFVADRRAKKNEIKEAIERGFNVKVDMVNVEITRKGDKKVYAKLNPNSDAVDVASRLGML